MSDIEIRRKILQVLYKNRRENYGYELELEDLQNNFPGIDNKIFLFNIDYLQEAGYIKFETFSCLEITPFGIDLVEDPSEFNRQFPDINIQVNVTVENFLVTVQQAIEQSDLSPEEKATVLDEIKGFLSNPMIAPFVGHGLLKMFGVG